MRRGLSALDLPDDVHQLVVRLIERHAGSGSAGAGSLELRIARSVYRLSIRRSRQLALRPATDGAWNMLLDLFIAEAEDRSISVSSLCIASGGPSTTALRQIGWLEREGLVSRYDDEHDGRRSWIRATPKAIALVRGYVAEWSSAILG